ncbi:MAG: hypothetical protein JW927_04370 [Deltaproteobacteria bacterium]|nr:hypothetical protein [Deltaproteobacteria bacterium]
MKRVKFILFFIFMGLCFSTYVLSKVLTSEDSCSCASGLECRKIITDTDYRNDGSGDWLHSNHVYQYKSKNGKSCNVTVNIVSSRFINCKVIYQSCYVSENGAWSKPGIVIEALGEGEWSYHLDLSYKWL